MRTGFGILLLLIGFTANAQTDSLAAPAPDTVVTIQLAPPPPIPEPALPPGSTIVTVPSTDIYKYTPPKAGATKGQFFIGGNVDISQATQSAANNRKITNFNLSLSPAFGAVLFRGFVLGARYSFGVTSNKAFSNNRGEYVTTTTFTSTIGPLLRYYIGKKQLKGVVTANANYITSTTIQGGNIVGTDGFSATGLLGAAYFFNPHLALEAGLYFTGTSLRKQFPATRLGFSVGLFVFVDKKKKE